MAHAGVIKALERFVGFGDSSASSSNDMALAIRLLGEHVVLTTLSCSRRLELISFFSPILVDLLESIREHLLLSLSFAGKSVAGGVGGDGEGGGGGGGGGEEEEKGGEVSLCNACLLFADVGRVFPHLRGLVQELLAHLRASCRVGAAECLVEASVRTKSGIFLSALRQLALQGCLGPASERGVDLGALLSLASSNHQSEEASFQALCMFCEALHLPLSMTQKVVRMRLGAEVTARLVLAEAKEEADLRNCCLSISSATATLTAAVADTRMEVAAAEEEATAVTTTTTTTVAVAVAATTMLDRPFGLSTLHLDGYSLSSHRRGASAWDVKMVPTETSTKNFLRLVQGVQTNLPLLVQGEVGCGKSFLIRELAAAMGHEATLLELHLDDQTDSKTLIGAYICSDVPGEFVWQAGVVTQAATKGNWLVIEDLDRVPLEVLAALSPLLERRQLYLPNRGEEVPVHPSFRIFGTRTLVASSKRSSSSSSSNSSSSKRRNGTSSRGVDDEENEDSTALELAASVSVPALRQFAHFWQYVTIDVPSQAEVEQIIEARFPTVLPIVKRKLMDTYRLFRTLGTNGGGGKGRGEKRKEEGGGREELEGKEGGDAEHADQRGAIAPFVRNSRQFTLRDLIKVSNRVARYSSSFNHASGYVTDAQKRDLLCEVVDVFAASLRDKKQFADLVHCLGACWEVSDAEIESFVLQAHPQQSIDVSFVTVGRAQVPITPLAVLTSSGQQFAFTKHALRVLERVAVCVAMNEPVLLVGETGSGKTTSVQELANMTCRKLVVQNLSLSTDASDLLGGFRPVTMKQLFQPSYELFVKLFQESFSSSQNAEYLQITATAFQKQQWKKLLKAFQKAAENAVKKLRESASSSSTFAHLEPKWLDFSQRVARFVVSLPRIEFGFAFAFVDGLLVEAMRNGHWVLLDEINLASPETLQGLAGVLDGQSLCLTEKGEVEPVARHPDFRIFAAMNPPTDVGKKELPASLRSRFTEIYTEEMTDAQDLCSVVQRYLSDIAAAPIDDIVSVYLGCRASSEMTLVDGAGQRPRYSLRSLTRSLRAAKAFMAINFRPLSRALFEGFLLNFQTLLGEGSRNFMFTFLKNSLGVPGGKDLSSTPTRPGGRGSSASDWELVNPFWLRRGPLEPTDWAVKDEATGIIRFVLTKTVEASIHDLAAAVASGVAPILLQGPTSVGKTTMIEYLAARTGHKCIRINNHEHTDVQEYIGGYVTNSHGHLEFKDGLLVEALRKGHWIILDELNLAPSDVLEALNRLLDDNKELYVPETGETLTPADGFALFATQNPPGAYGGRKPLSRAFRNRFLELSVCDLPEKEVEEIITLSCGIPPKFSHMLVQTMQELQMRRQQSSLFQGKGSVTTRDLIKWGRRQPASALEVAEEGFMLLAEKLRQAEEKKGVEDILNSVCRVKLQTHLLYVDPEESANDGSSSSSSSMPAEPMSIIGQEGPRQGRGDLAALHNVQACLRDGTLQVEGVRGVAVTAAMRRMWRLVGRCMEHNEPALLIGETGSGKTTVCQLYAACRNQTIRILNCHQSTETADIIGGLRPVRGREALLLGTLRKLVQVAVSFQAWGADFASGPLEEIISILANLQAQYIDDEKEVAATPEENSVKAVLDAFNSYFNQTVSVEEEEEAKEESAAKRAKIEPTVSGKGAGKKGGGDAKSKSMKHPPPPPPPTEKQILAGQIGELVAEANELWLRYKALFEWQDGPLITAMKQGDMFVLDEINLAEDAVIERLNSVLESGREITLAEKGGIQNEKIIAHPNFKFLATMNPGGDFGKRELSPALRSRFTEIWSPSVSSATDLTLIVSEILHLSCDVEPAQVGAIMVRFMSWLDERSKQLMLNGIIISVREVLAWARFISQSQPANQVQLYASVLHGAHMVMLDGLGLGLAASREAINALKQQCVEKLLDECPESVRAQIFESLQLYMSSEPAFVEGRFRLGNFSIPSGPDAASVGASSSSSIYVLNARSTVTNLSRILRAMQLPRPILLEGPPGVGKTSLIANLAALSGHTLVRINLSEHSEISDLLGTDLPASSTAESVDSSGGGSEGGAPASSSSTPKFVWCDGVFLTAMKAGHWVLLDELNLAPQSVLEGLNACFDHREEVYLPEIGKSFRCPPTFRVFCAQNPMAEGGGRKGLPQSFLTRFSRVVVEMMTEEDMREIAICAFAPSPLPSTASSSHCDGDEMDLDSVDAPLIASATKGYDLLHFVPSMVQFIRRMQSDIADNGLYGRVGAPWEFNLRDVFRWCELVQSTACIKNTSTMPGVDKYLIADAAHTLFVSRLRARADRQALCEAFHQVFGFPLAIDCSPRAQVVEEESTRLSADCLLVGTARVLISSTPYLSEPCFSSVFKDLAQNTSVRGSLAKVLEILTHAISLKWPVLIVGQSGNGKRRVIRSLARSTGNCLVEYSATSSTDSTELLGSFEQANPNRHLALGLEKLERACMRLCLPAMGTSAQSAQGTEFLRSTSSCLSLLSQTKYAAIEVAASNSLGLQAGKELRELLLHLLESLWVVSASLSPQEEEEDAKLAEGSEGALMRSFVNEARAAFDRCFAFYSTTLDGNNNGGKGGGGGGGENFEFNASGGFEWVDGVVVNALEKGQWLLIDNVNLCSASVLDRLNSLLEPGGFLLLTESGVGRVVYPHANFRIFFTMDSINGEISRAMRNRCVEIFVLNESDADASLFQGFPLSLPVVSGSSSSSITTRDEEKMLLSLFAAMSTPLRSGLLPVPETFPRHRLFTRILNLLNLEKSSGRDALESLQRSVETVLPSLLGVAVRVIELAVTAKEGVDDEVEGTSTSVAVAGGNAATSNLGLVRALGSWVPAQIHCCLLMLWVALYEPYVDLDVAHSWLTTCVSSSKERSKAAGVLFQEELAAAATADQSRRLLSLLLAQIDPSSLQANKGTTQIESHLFLPLVLGELVRIVALEEEWVNKLVENVIVRVFGLGKVYHFWKHQLTGALALKPLLSPKFYITTQVQESNCISSIVRMLLGAQSSVQGEMSVALVASSIGIYSLNYVDLWWRFVNATTFARLQCLFSEISAKQEVDESASMSNSTQLSSLFALAYAIDRGRIVAESKNLQILAAIFSTLITVDTLMLRLTTKFVAVALGDKQQAEEEDMEKESDEGILSHSVIRLVAGLLSKRDMLSRVLISTPASSPLPWEQVVICARWMSKALKSLSLALASCNMSVSKLCPIAEAELSRFDHAIGEYWQRPIFFEKLRLWKEGGHAVVPASKDGWELLANIRAIVRPLRSTCDMHTFVDTSLEAPNFGQWPQSLVPVSLLNEWLCLYSTFYFVHTSEAFVATTTSATANEQRESKRKREELKMTPIIAALHEQFVSAIKASEIFLLGGTGKEDEGAMSVNDNPNAFYNLDVGNGSDMIVFDQAKQICVEREQEHAGEVSLCLLAEPIILGNLLQISDALAAALNGKSLSAATAEQLEVLTKSVIALSLRHSTFDMLGLRELQSLLWCLEATRASGLQGSSLASFFALARCILCSLDVRIYSMTSRAVSNCVFSVDFTYSSRSLGLLLDPLNAAKRRAALQLPWDAVVSSGSVRLLQPTSLEAILMHVDLKALCPRLLEKGSVSLVSNSVASLTVSTCNDARKRLLQLFRMAVAANNDGSKGKDVVSSVARLSLLGLICLDIIFSLRDFFPSDSMLQFEHLRAEAAASSGKHTSPLFEAIGNMHFASLCSDASMGELLKRCLQPVLILLADASVHTTPDEHLPLIGHAWVQLGLLKLHLVLPPLPVDPATKAAVKAQLLREESSITARRVVLHHALSSLSGGAAITPSMVTLTENIQASITKSLRLERHAIVRPCGASPFNEVFFELKDACDSLGNVERALQLSERFFAAYKALASLSTRALSADAFAADSKALLETMHVCVREEIVWQGSACSFVDRMQGDGFCEYEDVTSPVVSALQHVSSGLRIVAGWFHSKANNIAATGGVREGESLERAWKSILMFPPSGGIRLSASPVSDAEGEGAGAGVDFLTVQALQPVSDLLHSTENIVLRAIKILSEAKEAQGGDSALSSYPRPAAIDSVSPGLVLLLALARIDYLVGGGTVSPEDVYALFNGVLIRFVETHLRNEDERKRLADLKASLYRNKVQEKSFEANDAKEEEAALRAHFPDHLREFRDMFQSTSRGGGGTEGDIAALFGDAEENAHAAEEGEIERASASLGLGEETAAALVGHHARMVFLHVGRQLIETGKSWLRLPFSESNSSVLESSGGGKRKKKKRANKKAGGKGASTMAPSALALREALHIQLVNQSLVTAKALDWGLKRLVAPRIEAALRGCSLISLSVMADCCLSSSANVTTASSTALWTMMTGDSTKPSSVTIDRDLLLMLDDKSEGNWRPLDFHTDPSPTEAARASGPLQSLFRRASALLDQFSGNEILLQVCQMSTRIADFHTTTPLGKLLISLELLLRKTQEWEEYAAKHVSLREQMAAVSSIIAQWRTIELQSWEQLLRCKEVVYARRALGHWFSIARALRTEPEIDFSVQAEAEERKRIIKAKNARSQYHWPSLVATSPSWLLPSLAGNVDARGREEVQEGDGMEGIAATSTLEATKKGGRMTSESYLAKIFDILDGFLKGSVVGEFAAKLHLVRLFALQLQQENQLAWNLGSVTTEKRGKASHSSTSALSNAEARRLLKAKTAHIVFGVWHYYAQFLPLVRTFQDTLREPILTKLKGEVKIGKWDQLGTYALIEHSEKVHRKLNKLIREYQGDVLDYPLSAVLRRDMIGDLASEQGELQAAVTIPPASSIFPSMSHLNDGVKATDTEPIAFSSLDVAKFHLDASLALGFSDTHLTSSAASTSSSEAFPKLSRTKALSARMDKYLDEVLILRLEVQQPKPLAETASSKKSSSRMLVVDDDGVAEGEEEDDDEEEEEEEDNELSFWRFSGKARYGFQGAEVAESLCAKIFARIASLRSDESTKSAKQRAIGNLLNGLKEQGISHLRNGLPNELKHAVHVLAVSSPLPCEVAGDLLWNAGLPRDAFEKAESYYIRNLAELTQLRTQAVAPMAHDVSLRDVGVMLGLSENMFANTLRLRLALRASLGDYRELLIAVKGIKEAVTAEGSVEVGSTSLASATPVPAAIFSFARRALNVTLDNLVFLRRLVSASCIAQQAINLEKDPALPVVPSSEIRTASEASEKALALVQDLANLLSNIVDEEGEADDHLLAPFGSFVILNPGSSSEGRGGGKGGCTSKMSRVLHGVKEALSTLDAARDAMCATVSRDVFVPMCTRLEELVETLSTSLSSGALDSTSPHEQLHQQQQQQQYQQQQQQDGSETARLLSSIVDGCLVAVQRLKSLALLDANTAPQVAATAREECIGGTYVAPFASSFSSSSSTAHDDMTEEGGNGGGGVGDGGDEQAIAHTLDDCLTLGVAALAALHPQQLLRTMVMLHTHLTSSASRAEVDLELVRASMPLVRRLIGAYGVLLADLCSSYKGSGKLLYVCLRVFRVLLAKGLCSDESKDEEGEGDVGNMTFSDDHDGTGMGEGQGAKDVSDQIENEEQLLGLKDENKDEPAQEKESRKQLKEEEEEKGVEMDQDFDGELYDLPEEKEQGQEDKVDKDEDEDEEEELEREMGEDIDGEIVDEKQWNSDEDEEDEEGEEGFEKDSKMQGEAIEGETRTKDEDEKDGGGEEKAEKNPAGKEKGGMEEEEEEDEEGEGKVNEEDEADVTEKLQGVDVRQEKIEEQEEEEGAEEGGEAGVGEGEEEDEAGADDDAEGQDIPDNLELFGGEGKEENDDKGDEEGDDNQDEGMDVAVEDEEERAAEEEQEEKEDEEEDAHHMQVSGAGTANEEQPQHKEEDEESEVDEEEEKKDEKKQPKKKDPSQQQPDRPPAFGVRAGEHENEEAVLGVEEKDPEDEDPDQSHDPDKEAQGPKGSGGASEGEGKEGTTREIGGSNREDEMFSQKKREPPNPFKQQGDVNKAWHRRLNIAAPIEEEEDDQADEVQAPEMGIQDKQEPPVEDGGGRGTYEFANDDDDEEGGEQVLADIPEEQAVQVPQAGERSAADRREDEDDDAAPPHAMEEDAQVHQEEEKKRNRPVQKEKERKKRREEDFGSTGASAKEMDGSEKERTDDAMMNEEEEEEEEEDPKGGEEEADVDDEANVVERPKMHSDTSFRLGEQQHDRKGRRDDRGTEQEEEEEDGMHLELEEDWHLRGGGGGGGGSALLAEGRELWARHRAATESHSMRLCEQLRLILEPTLATRLQGDYRTGKRINMRRVIGYVASGFRKDKIWLRRTKPAKREYQIMVMIDDSKSMGEAGPLALSSLTTIANALSRLEVGELCVASFAEQVRVLHPFSSPFNDEAGARVVSQFAFSAGRTLLGSSLEAIAPVFAGAKGGRFASSGAAGAVVLQICFVISDAKIDSDNRERLDGIVRSMAEQHILVVLVIIDKTLNPKDSIFETRSVEFRGDRVVTTSYLDDFPFPYYIAIQKLEALPDVLSDALKQWFELINSQLASGAN